MKQKMQQILSTIVDKDPGVQNAASFLGGGPGGSSNQANLFVILKPGPSA
jgi:multidrug efflux pump subunit AcrB